MKPLSLFLSLIGLVAPGAARASVVVAVQNQETPVAVNAELGSILQLPSPVRTITPSQHFSIQDVGSAMSEGGKADVRTFHIKPVARATSEAVTFVLASGRALALRFIPTPNGDKFYDVQLDSSARRGRDAKFLSSEMAMMRAMLLDDAAGFARESLDEKVQTDFPELEFSVLRVYAASDLTGYVFRVLNKGSAALDLNMSALAFSRPNRAALSQADKQHLEPCPLIGSAVPACQTAIRLVVRGPKPAQPMLGTLGHSTPPFAKSGASIGGGDK